MTEAIQCVNSWAGELWCTTRRPAGQDQEENRLAYISAHVFNNTHPLMVKNVKVVQELMRHANSRCTLDVYRQATVSAKREAQQRIVEMVLPENGLP